MDMEQRIDRTIGTMKAAEKRKLLDTHIGPVMPGHKPDAEDDERYLRGIVEGMLRDHDAQVEAIEASGLAELELRVAQLERRLSKESRNKERDFIFETVGKAMAKAIRESGLMRHLGTWEADRAYGKGACVIQDGATWLAIADTPEAARPGKALEWRLIAKGDKQ